jgi:hypothetical protein
VLSGHARDRVVGALMALLLLYYAATPGVFQGKGSGDGIVDFLFLPSVLVHHTLDVSAASAAARHWAMPVMHGRMTNYLPVGPPIAWAPLYLVSLGIETAMRPFGAMRDQPFGVNAFSYWMCGLASLLWSFVGLGAAYRLLNRHLGRGAARFGLAGAVLGTPLTWYIVTQPLYQHALSFVVGAIFVERWDAYRSNLTMRRCIALGALGGAAALIRQQDVLWLALPAADLVGGLVRDRRASWIARGAAMAAVALAVFLPQLLVWTYYYGAPRSPLVDVSFMRWGAPSFLGVLFSTRGGLLAWSPILYLALAGLWLGRRRLGGLAVPLGAIFLVQLYVNAAVWDWWGGWAYGARRFCDLTVVYALGLGGLWVCLESLRAWRAAVAVIVAVLVAGNFVAMEYVRALATPSSEFTEGAWERLQGAGAPRVVVLAFKRLGWPFVWPISIPFALSHRVPVRTFEEIYGAYLGYRSYWDHHVLDAVARPDRPEGRRYFVSGFGEPDPATGLVPVGGTPGRPARMLAPLFRREPMRVHLEGTIPQEPPLEIRWNGEPVSPRPDPRGLVFELPESRVRHEVNELALVLPAGSRLAAVRFEPTGPESPDFHGPPWDRRPASSGRGNGVR